MTLEQEIGRRIAVLRKRAGMSQEELGVRMGVVNGRCWPRQTVSLAEKGRRGLAAPEMLALSELLEVPIEQLFHGIPPCEGCNDSPPAGFTCNDCGATGVRSEAT
jgi:transcriptional regulator with XRE-family HTH domain